MTSRSGDERRRVHAMLDVQRWPNLRSPVLVVAFAGWVDAGFAGAGAAAALIEQLSGAEVFATLDLADLCDLQQTRPAARFVEGGIRRIDWPRIDVVAGRAGRDVVVAHGPEPSLSWPSVAAAVVDLARKLGVTEAATVGGMPALVTHRRPPPVLATATSRALAQELSPLRPDYAGPTGLQTALQHALGAAGIPCAGLWAQVPQYISGSPSPPAVRALLHRLGEVYRLDLDLRDLDARCDAYVERVEQGLAERPDVKDIVDRLDRESPNAPSGEDLVSEIERFLRSQREE
jgi:predicted ATP-grasp superfamily ATP-dependent carboligase